MSKAKQTEELVETPKNTAMERPSFIKTGDARGTENIGKDDIVFPALKIAQDTTAEAKRADPAYVKGLQSGMFFNSVTKDIYGEEPITIVVVNQLGHRNVEFAPFDEGGGVIDFNVPDGDPRTQFQTKLVDGKEKRVKPAATLFYDYLVLALLPEGAKVMTLSLKSTQIKKAKVFNSRLLELKQKGVASFSTKFTAAPTPESRGGQTFYGWRIEPAGWVDEKTYAAAEAAYGAFSGKEIKLETVADEEPENQFS